MAANDFVRIPTVVNKAAEKLALGEPLVPRKKDESDREWLVSAPGKVILFGEHAVVHGVVSSNAVSSASRKLTNVLDRSGCLRGSSLLRFDLPKI